MSDKKTSATATVDEISEMKQRAEHLERLVTLFMENSADELAEKKQRKELQQRKRESAQRSSVENERALNEAIRKCRHLKGTAGAGLRKGVRRDPALAIHTYVTGAVRVKCISGCSLALWFNRKREGIPDDTASTIYRATHDGKAYESFPNPTIGSKDWPNGLSADEAYRWATDESTNRPSSSEIPAELMGLVPKDSAELVQMKEEIARLQKQIASFSVSE